MYEPDLEYYLARRKGLAVDSQQVAPSLYVTDRIDAVKLQACQRFGLLPIEARASDFFAWLQSEASPIPEPMDLVLPSVKDRPAWLARVPASDLRIFFRQWFQVVPEELPDAPSNAEPAHLLQGLEPRWYHFKADQDIMRSSERGLIQQVSQWVSSAEGARTVLVTGEPGEGKSTALKRVAVELAKSGVLVFFFRAPNKSKV